MLSKLLYTLLYTPIQVLYIINNGEINIRLFWQFVIFTKT